MSYGVTIVRRCATAALGVIAILGGLVVSTGAITTPVSAIAGTNETINFQGRLFNAQGAVVADGYYNIQFKIYQDGDGQSVGNTTGSPAGTLKWTESYLNSSSKGVLVKNGYMSVELGSVNAFANNIDWNQNTLWLSMNIGSTNTSCSSFATCTPDGEMTPMKRLSSTPYALNAARLNGLTSSSFIQNTTTVQQANLAIQSLGATNIGMVIQGAASQTADVLQLKAAGVTAPLLAVSANGQVGIQTTSAGDGNAFTIKSSQGNNALTVDTTNSRFGFGLGGSNLPSLTGAGVEILGALRLSGSNALATSTDTYITPMGSQVQTKINIPYYDPGNYGQIIAMGVPASAAATSRVMSLFDARNGAHQPTISVFSPNEMDVFGLSWDGSTSEARLKSSGNLSAIHNNNLNVLTARNNNGVANVGIGNAANSGFALDVTGDVNSSSQYRINGQTTLTSSALTFNAASGATIQSAANQSMTLVGGSATNLNGNGGNVTVYGGDGNGTGVRGLVNLGPAAFASVTTTACATDCTISKSNVDTYGSIVVSASTPGITITLPAPSTLTAGRTVYIATSSTSQDFNLRTNAGADILDVAMRKNTTSTMIWNGTAWTPGGASNATTLQATYNNGSNPATTPEIKLDSIRGTIDIQDADTSIGADLLNIRSSNAAGLGTVLFGVSNNGRVTIQGTTDQSSAFRVLDSNGNYQMNVNSSNGYIVNNSISTAGNEIKNAGLEAGGQLAGGEEGWFGPAVANIVNDTTNAHGGNYSLQVGANSSQIDVYAGTYYEVQPGNTLQFRGWVKNSAGANGTAGIQLTWLDRNKAVLSTSTDYATLPGTSYIQKNINATAPAGAAYVRASAVVRPGATTGIFYFDDFVMNNTLQSGAMTFRNTIDSTNAFKIQSASSAQTLFTADTTNNRLKVGDNIGLDTGTTLLVLDNTVADPTSNLANGGLFYRSDTNSLKAVIGGSVVDICTTAVTCNGYSASAGSSISLQSGSPGTKQIGNFNISGTGILTRLQTEDNASGNTQSLSMVTGNSAGGVSGNITIDTGTATSTRGSITIGTGNVGVTMGGTLSVQGSNTLALGQSSTNTGSILFRSAAGSNTVTLRGPVSAGTSYALTLPSNLGAAGECMKTDTTGNIYFQGCGVGVNFNLQDAYNNSNTPADISLTDGKSLSITAVDTAGTDPNILFNLQCGNTCTTGNKNGRFSVQNKGTDIFTVSPNSAGITLNAKTQIGSSQADDGVQTLFQLDSFNGSNSSEGACSSTSNQGAMYYNTSMGSIRSCINGAWSDVSNPDTLGLLTFGIVPSSGNRPYDLPSLVDSGYSGPCKVSFVNTNTVHVEPCIAYSNGRRVTVANQDLSINQAVAPNTNLTSGGRWGHVCLNPITGQPEFTSTTGLAAATAGMPDSNATFNAAAPMVCLADVVATTAGGIIDDIYDTRTFTSAMKEAVNVSSAAELGMIVDAGGTNGGMVPAAAASAKLYGVVVATNGQTSAGAPNAIVTTVGPGWVKAIAGTAGQFVKTSTTNGYGNTTAAIPNNSFYYSVGNTRTSYNTTCTTSSNCSGSLYVNFIVR